MVKSPPGKRRKGHPPHIKEETAPHMMPRTLRPPLRAAAFCFRGRKIRRRAGAGGISGVAPPGSASRALVLMIFARPS